MWGEEVHDNVLNTVITAMQKITIYSYGAVNDKPTYHKNERRPKVMVQQTYEMIMEPIPY